MNKVILTGGEARQARDELGLSQRKVADEAVVNRHILSQFEQQKIVPKDDFMETLKSYFEENGYVFASGDEDELEMEPSAPAAVRAPALPAKPMQSVKPDYYLRDGFVVAGAIDDSEADEILEELDKVHARIEELQQQDVEYGWFSGDLVEDCQDCADELKVLMAHAYCLVRKLQGHEVVEPCVEEELEEKQGDQAGVLGQLITKHLSFMEEEAA